MQRRSTRGRLSSDTSQEKEKEPETTTTSPAKSKSPVPGRPRGRPRRSSTSSTTETSQEEEKEQEVVPTPVKSPGPGRPRGRPRRESSTSATESPTTESSQVEEKEQEQNPTPSKSPGRPRGRPPLSSTSIVDVTQELDKEEEQDIAPNSPPPKTSGRPRGRPPSNLVTEYSQEKDSEGTPTPVPTKPGPGRPRRSLIKLEPDDGPPILTAEQPTSHVVLNARGMPIRQRKRNRYYDSDDDDKSPVLAVKSKPVEKRVKIEPLQILLDNPANSLQVTPIISEVEVESPVEIQTPVVQAKKSVVKLVMPPKITVEPGTSLKAPEPMKPHIPRCERLTTKSLEFGRTLTVAEYEAQHKSKINIPRKDPLEITPITTIEIPKPQVIRMESIKTEFPRSDVYKRSDYSSFIRFFANVKTKCIMPDRWGINGVMFDPVKKMKTFTMSEMEISSNGDLRVKKCLQVFEDLSIKVVIHGQDLTKRIEGLRKLHSEVDIPSIVARITALKVCTGVKSFGPQDTNYHPTAKKIGACYFSADCQTILSLNYVGALCPPCNKLRNAVRRRKQKQKMDREKNSAKLSVRRVQSSFGRAVYSFLNQLMDEDKSKKTLKHIKLEGGLMRPLQEIKLEPGRVVTDGRRRSTPKAPRKIRVEPKLPKRKAAVNMRGPLTFTQMIDPTTGLSQDVYPQGFVDEDGNIHIPNGGEFTFADGQEYELIGEADPVEPMLVEAPEEQTIQIIEIDDQTMAQFTAQNISMSGMFFHHDPANIQVTEIDPNDPNTVFKVISNPELFLHEQKVKI